MQRPLLRVKPRIYLRLTEASRGSGGFWQHMFRTESFGVRVPPTVFRTSGTSNRGGGRRLRRRGDRGGDRDLRGARARGQTLRERAQTPGEHEQTPAEYG